ncbi:MAG: altronate dehydrogenase [Planctomycetes bacterium]|nr:altronate dehydrogenase [Planctomycetota bacterium]
MNTLPETILQFGSGRFLRAFADLFIHQANLEGQNVGRVVIVQSTGEDRASALAKQGGIYHVVIRGYEDGKVIDRVEECTSVSRALVAGSAWDEIRRIARSPELKYVLSNTTEAGYTLDASDTAESAPPKSFPAKLLLLLRERFEAGQPGLTIIPCELMEGNADLLLKTQLDLCDRWKLAPALKTWLSNECVWLHTLVDRIVSGTPKDHPLLATDPMVIVGEPFAFFALEEKAKAYPFIKHPAITRTPDVKPYFLRKVRILNAAHTALLIKAVPRGFKLVREAIADPVLEAWLNRLLNEEIVPLLKGRVEEPELFARQTLDRFRNPFLDHKFSDIFLHQESKIKIRLQSSQAEYETKFGKKPPLLTEVISEGIASLSS